MMDPIALIVNALVAGVVAAAKPTARQAVKDTYAAFKALIQRKFGDEGDVAAAVEQVEKKPDSAGRKGMLAEELGATGAGQDAEVLRAARDLLALVQPRSVDESQMALAENGSAAATGGAAATVGDGNITITAPVKGGLTIMQGGAQTEGMVPEVPRPVDTDGYDLAVVRDLLLAAFTASGFRRLFLYTANPDLRSLSQKFGDSDGLTVMVDKTLRFCLVGGLLPDLLTEVERANARQYARYADRLRTEL
jgi:hypothetical protein